MRTTIFLSALLVFGCSSSNTNTGSGTTTGTTENASSGGAATTTTTTTTTTTDTGSATATTTTGAGNTASTGGTASTATPDATTGATTTTTTATTGTGTGATPAPAVDPQLLARGRQAFERACGDCHEANDPEGPTPNKNWEEARMRTQVRQGGGRMRAIPVRRLSDTDLDAMIAFFRSTHAVR